MHTTHSPPSGSIQAPRKFVTRSRSLSRSSLSSSGWLRCTRTPLRQGPHRACGPTSSFVDSGLLGEAGGEHALALLGTLAAVGLCLAEELGELAVLRALRILDVVLQSQRVAQTRLGEPDDVVVLVGSAGDVAGLGIAHCHVDPLLRLLVAIVPRVLLPTALSAHNHAARSTPVATARVRRGRDAGS